MPSDRSTIDIILTILIFVAIVVYATEFIRLGILIRKNQESIRQLELKEEREHKEFSLRLERLESSVDKLNSREWYQDAMLTSLESSIDDLRALVRKTKKHKPKQR